MDGNKPHDRPPYSPPRRKPVPTNNSPQPQQQGTYHRGFANNQQGSSFPEVPHPQNYPPTSASHYAGSPPYGPVGGNYQHYNQNQGLCPPHFPPYAPEGQRDQNQYAAQPPPLSSNWGAALSSLGSLMKSAVKATFDPNNTYGNTFGQQQNGFGHEHNFGQLQPAFGQQQAPVLNQSHANGASIVNGQVLDAAATSRLQSCGIVPMPGRYWYDNKCGAWGLESGPCIGILPSNLSLGGPLAANASGASTTGVFINGRQIHALDASRFQAMGITCIPGRWWVSADGTYGIEGNMIPWGNLRMAAMASKRTHSGYGSWSNGDSFGGSDGQGFNYVGGHDSTGRMWSVTTDGSGYFSS